MAPARTDGTAPKVVVVGSAHVDLIASAERLPTAGESVVGDGFATAPGGKAANQAAQLARCGAAVSLVSRLGDDAHGAMLRDALAAAGVALDHLAIDAAATGASTVFAAAGDYASIIVPGAAGRLSETDIASAAETIRAADALALQLEIDPGVSTAAADVALGAGRLVVLNASPAPRRLTDVPPALLDAATVLVVNEVEAARLAGTDAAAADLAAALAAAVKAREIVITRGGRGALALDDGRWTQIPAFPAAVVDAVGAGDAFLGAYVAARLAGAPVADAAVRAAAAGSIAVTRSGAFFAQPTAAEIDAFLAVRR